MDTIFSTNRKFKRMFVNILSIVAILAIAFPAMGSVSAQDANPWFTVFPEQGAVEGWDWPLHADIHMTIDDPNTQEISPDFEKNGIMVLSPWDPDSGATWLWIDFSEEYSVKPGDVVTLSLLDDGTMEQTHAVRNLAITYINSNDNTVFGTADPEQSVTLWSWEDPDGRRIETTAGGGGNWGVDFDDVDNGGFDLEPGYHVRAEVWDGDNDTAVDWEVRNPHFTVFPEWEWFDGLDWPDGANVLITVENKPECETMKESWDYFFNGSFGEGCDLEIGDTVTFTDGKTTRSHEVQNLSVTVANANSDVVSGKANPGTTVYVWPHEAELEPLQAIAHKVTGSWRVDFKEVSFDLAQRMGGRSEVRDENGNSTAVDWEAKASSTGLWIVAYTYDAPVGSWEEGLHAYQFEFDWTIPEPGGFVGQEGELFVSSGTSLYEGHVLLRGPSTLRRIIVPGGANCEDIDSINPDQPTRFLVGWIPEYEMTYPEARAYFESISARVVWDDGASAELIPHELRPFSFESVDAWFKYACTFTIRK